MGLCAVAGVIVSYYWRVFYGLDARGVPPLQITGLCVVLAMAAGALIYRAGLAEGRHMSKGGEIRATPLPERKTPTNEPEELRRMRKLLNNVDNYDGSGKGQKEVR